MADNLALLLVHGSLAILVYRLITQPDPEDPDKPKTRPGRRFQPRRPTNS